MRLTTNCRRQYHLHLGYGRAMLVAREAIRWAVRQRHSGCPCRERCGRWHISHEDQDAFAFGEPEASQAVRLSGLVSTSFSKRPIWLAEATR